MKKMIGLVGLVASMAVGAPDSLYVQKYNPVSGAYETTAVPKPGVMVAADVKKVKMAGNIFVVSAFLQTAALLYADVGSDGSRADRRIVSGLMLLGLANMGVGGGLLINVDF